MMTLARLRPRRGWLAAMLLGVVLAGCGAAADGSPTPALPAPVTPKPSGVPEPDRPPAASMVFAGGPLFPGALGGWTWDDQGDAAPWLPGAELIPVQAGGTLTVLLEGDAPVEAWRARWAPLLATGVGNPVDGIDGRGPIGFGAPPPGTWSVQVEATFGLGRNATYYWRVQVGS